MRRVRGTQYWKAKDYFNGLNVGRYLVEDKLVCVALERFACGDFMRFWALLPGDTRKRCRSRLKQGMEDNVYGWIEDYDVAEPELRTTILAGLEMTIDPSKILRRFAPPPSYLDNTKFAKYLKDIEDGLMVPHADYGVWVWAAAKFYRESSGNVWIFWMKLDMNYTGHFSSLGLDYNEVGELSGKTLTKVLAHLNLKEISILRLVSKIWRRAIWMCFFDYPPVAYQRIGDTIKVIW